MPSEHVIFSREGSLGRMTLNRPEALNALTKGMVAAMLPQLRAWADDPSVRAVVIDAVPGRAFCAGGDVRDIYELGRSDHARAMEFFSTEYPLNSTIKHFPKPYIALLHGIAMGGGVGVSVHGSHRIVCENTAFAMPETAIGLFPDVGGSYFLPRLKGALGMYIALMGTRLAAADTLYAGIATHFVRAARFPEIVPRLAQGKSIETILDDLAGDAGDPPLAARCAAIDRAFAAPSVEAILAALEKEDAWGRETAKVMATRSPTSLKLTFRQMRDGATLDFNACLRMEYRLMYRMLKAHDFYEGVRAAVIDKDQQPRWRPDTLAAVSDDDIARYFLPLGGQDIVL